MNPSAQTHPAAAAALETAETRVALRLVAHLNEGAEALPYDISERLRFARERALAAAQHQRRLATVAASMSAGQGTAALAGGPRWWIKLAAVMPLVLLVAGLVLIERHEQIEQIQVAAEIDSALLADDLPPDAYTDPGFQEYLRLHRGR